MFELRYGIMNNGERYESNETKMRSFRHCFRAVMSIFHFVSDEWNIDEWCNYFLFFVHRCAIFIHGCVLYR